MNNDDFRKAEKQWLDPDNDLYRDDEDEQEYDPYFKADEEED